MEINVVSQIEFELKDQNLKLFQEIASRVVSLLKVSNQYVFSIIFVNDSMIHEINRDYRNIDRPTDVISFALLDGENTYETDQEEDELGDIFINIDAVNRQAVEYGHSFDRELSFLFTHGLLHLLGYDHIEEEEEKTMFKLQDEILDGIIRK